MRKKVTDERELKFRVWDRTNKEYVSYFDLKSMLDKMSSLNRYRLYCVEQCTGIKDSEGADIYESDIVEDTEKNVSLKLVYFQNGAFCLGECVLRIPDHLAPMQIPYDSKLRVVGNIHQNKNLLEDLVE